MSEALPETMQGEEEKREEGLATIPEIVAELRAGRMVVLVDDEDRENEGDLVLAAECVTPEAINFMSKYGRGLICLTLTPERCAQLGLRLMTEENGTLYGTAFTVSIEAASGVSTGISAYDRAHTIRTAVARHAKPSDLVQPGHVFPLMARKGGVLIRAGHTEAGCDLAALAGFEPAAVICEILSEDGSMARLPELRAFAARHGLRIGAIRDLIEYRLRTEVLVERVEEREVNTPWGRFRLSAFRDRTSGDLHWAMWQGTIGPEEIALVRVHEPLSVLDFLDPEGRTHSVSLPDALARVAHSKAGVVVMLYRPQRGEELLMEFSAVKRPRRGWDPRFIGIGAQILRVLGVRKMRVLSHPMRFPNLSGFGLEVVGFEE
ncbi:MAG: bifunctional 3,4-dihydroxy-2-butanone-4-phosphate synthase/GTP cyclohydrolase II [Hydrogenophilus sp.]|nr:bifunctional 3,4-dihydroxy-2-butanone-4-phosphate synthase/GTP cyclohydrolase II [Hydrogenophilus sp.]